MYLLNFIGHQFSTLTTGVNTFTGASGNDSFDGSLVSGAQTWQASDALAGGDGTDTITATLIASVTPITMTGIEVVNATVTTAATLNLANATGVTNVNSVSSTATTTFSGITTAVTPSISESAADHVLTYTGVSGSADAETVNLTAATGGLSVAGIELLTLNGVTSASTLTNITGSTATTLTATGDQALTITAALPTTVTNVTASTKTAGALTVTMGAVAAATLVGGAGADSFNVGSVTGTVNASGGAGNDTFVATTNLTIADTITGGDGTADTLSAPFASVSTAGYTTPTTRTITGIETLVVTDDVAGALTAVGVDTGITTVSMAATTNTNSAVTFNAGASTLNIGLSSTTAGTAATTTAVIASSLAVVGATTDGDNITIKNNNSTAGTANAFAAINIAATNTETLTINTGSYTVAVAQTSGTVGVTGSTGFTTAETLVITGANRYTPGVVTADIINASAMTFASVANAPTYDGSAGTTAQTVTGSAGNDILIVSTTSNVSVNGGAGNDTITGGVGNDTLIGDEGDDSITSGAGNDSISAGGGNDTINMAGNLTSADTIDGGAGTLDTLIVTALPALAMTNVTNVETLILGGAGSSVSLAANVSFTSIDMDDGTTVSAQALTLATGYTNATTVLVDVGDSVTNTANAALTITSTDAKMSTTTITGGTGTDTLNITATAAHAGAALTLAGLITNVETINLLDGGDVTTGTVTAGSDMSLTIGAYASAATVATTLTVDASTLDVGTLTGTAMNADFENATINGSGVTNVLVKLVLTGGAGADTLTGGAGNDVIVGGAGNDQITGGTGLDNLSGGDGIDTFVMSNTLTFQDTISGGAGVDVMTLTSVADADLTAVTLVETLTLSGTGTLGALASAAGILTVNTHTTAAAVDASGMTTAITINALGAGVDQTLTGGSGADTFNFGSGTAAQDSLSTAETVNGGAGTDTLFISNSVAAVTAELNLNTGKVTNIENVTLGTASGLASTSAETFALTITDVTLTTVQTVAISGAAITDVLDTILITNNATNAVGGTSFSITGGAGADTLTGGVNNDTINGGGGADSITGGSGADSLTGAAGNDLFAFALESVSTNLLMDTISDFTTGTDAIVINAGTTTATNSNVYDFTNKGAVTSNADAMALLSGSGAVNSTTVRIGQYAFNTATNTLVMDSDGNGMIQSADLAVKLSSVTALATADVRIVVTAGAATDQTITTGGGADTITFGALLGVASITAGAGDDSLNTTVANLTAADTIIGGLGNDTLTITTAGTATLTTDANLTGVENIVLGADSSTLNLTGQTEGFNVTTSNGTNAVTLGAIASTVTGGTGADTITVATNAVLLLDSINGSTGTDVLTIATADLTVTDASFVRVSGMENLTLTGASTVVLGANATTAGIATVTTGNAATSITSTQTSLAVTGSLMATTAVLTLLGSANYTVTSTGTVHDRITATGSTGTLTATFGDAGSNGITVAAGSGNVVLTGAGTTDTITVTGLATAGQTFTGNAGTSVIFNVTGGAGAQTITGGAGNDLIVGGGGVDNLQGGLGEDRFSFSTGQAAGLVTIQGGGGTDAIVVLTSTDFSTALGAGATLLTAGGIEAVSITPLMTATFLGSQLTGQAIAFNTVGDGVGALVVTAAAGTTTDLSSLTFTGVTVGATTGTAFASGNDTIVVNMGATATTVVGSSIADSIVGGAGDDVITGGADGAVADTLAGGEGNDTFLYDSSTLLINGGNAVIDAVNGGGGTADAIRLTTQTGFTLVAANLLARITNVEKITAGISAGAISLTGTADANTFTSTSFNTIDLSGDTSATGINVVSMTGATGISTITGSAGVDQFTIGATSTTATITGGAGLDTYAVNATGNNGFTVAYTAIGDSPVGVYTNGAGDLRTLGDVITYAGAAAQTYKIDLSALGVTAINSITTIAVGSAAGNLLTGTAGVLAITQGVHLNGVFTAGAADTDQDLLIQWDTNGATAGGVESVLVDSSATTGDDLAVGLLGVITVTIV